MDYFYTKPKSRQKALSRPSLKNGAAAKIVFEAMLSVSVLSMSAAMAAMPIVIGIALSAATGDGSYLFALFAEFPSLIVAAAMVFRYSKSNLAHPIHNIRSVDLGVNVRFVAAMILAVPSAIIAASVAMAFLASPSFALAALICVPYMAIMMTPNDIWEAV
jgi:ABC-type Fe3+-siderophore transport system permease subunit